MSMGIQQGTKSPRLLPGIIRLLSLLLLLLTGPEAAHATRWSTKAAANPLKFEAYGKFCGPYNSGPGAPIDALDKCCFAHDACYYRDQAWGDCNCDIPLNKCVQAVSWYQMNYPLSGVVVKNAIIYYVEEITGCY